MSVSISGFNSPFNTDKIIQQLLKIERRPIRRLERRVSQTKSTQSVFKTLNKKANGLEKAVESLLSPSTFNQKKASSSDTSIFTASINSNDATTGTFDVTVEQLAKKASVKSGQFINDQKMFGTNQDTGEGATSISDFEMVEGSDTLDPSEADLDDLSKSVTTTGDGMDGSGDGNAEFTITVPGPGPGPPVEQLQVDLDSFNNFKEVMDFVNNNLNQVKMRFDSSKDKFFFIPTAQNGEGGMTFEVQDQNGTNFLSAIGVATDDSGDVHRFDTQQSDGTDIDGDGNPDPQNLISISADQTFNNGLRFTSDLATSGTVKINNTEIDFDSDSSSDPVSTINEFVNRVNEKVEGVKAKFNPQTDKVVLKTENTGTGQIDVQDVSGNLANVLNLEADGDTSDDGVEDAAGQANAIENLGQDAKIKFEGDTITDSDNKVKVDGVTLNLKDTGSADLTVSQDTKAIVDNVQKFVDKFNNLIEFINKKSKERAPDSVDGEGSPSDSGPLLGEGTSRLIKSRISDIVTSKFQEATSSGTKIDDLSDIGIELTNPIDATDTTRGTLKFDSSEFKEALKQNPGQVQELFTAKEGDSSRGGNQDGVAVQLNSFLEDATKSDDGLISSRIEGFDKRINRLNERIDDQEERVQEIRKRLERKFRRMEKLLAGLQQQRSFLSARL